MGEVPKQLKQYVFKKGNTLGGRKKGKTLKEYARNYLAKMTDEERLEYLNGLDRDLVWKMAEGNPPQKNTLDGEIRIPKPLLDNLDNVDNNNINKKDTESQRED